MEGFDDLEQEYHIITNELSRNISKLEKASSQKERIKYISLSSSNISDVEMLLKRMENEIKHLGYSSKQKVQQKIDIFTNSFKDQKRLIDKLKSKKPKRSRQNEEQRRNLLQADKDTDESYQSLQNSHRITQNIKDSGNQITSELRGHREIMVRSKDHLEETNSILARARRSVSRMNRRVVTNKLIYGLIIMMELAILGILIYVKSGGKTKGGK